MKESMPVQQVEKGMFVLELDRPWLGTPFLLQGFLVEDEDQIADLRKYCSMVTIDRLRSVGEHFRAEPHEAIASRFTASDQAGGRGARSEDGFRPCAQDAA